MGDLVGLAEIAQRAGVTKDAVNKWRARHTDFPAPEVVLAATPVWEWDDIEQWLKVTGRSQRDS
jgi:hypothetical protein